MILVYLSAYLISCRLNPQTRLHWQFPGNGSLVGDLYLCIRAYSVAQSSPTLWDPMDCIWPGSPVHGILQARILEWVVNSSSRWSSPPKDQTRVSCVSCTVSRFFITEPPGKPNLYLWDDWILLFILLLAMRASSNLTEHPFGFCYIGQSLLCGGAQTTQRQHRGFRVCPHPTPTIS